MFENERRLFKSGEQGANERDPLLLLLAQSDPAFDFLHADLRYRYLIQKMGLPAMYREMQIRVQIR
jgi:hypothetical protein